MALTLTLFKNQWCANCKQVAPIVSQIAAQYAGKIEVKEVDIVSDPDAAAKHGILSIPTLVISKNGQEVERISGFISKDNLIKRLNLEEHQ